MGTCDSRPAFAKTCCAIVFNDDIDSGVLGETGPLCNKPTESGIIWILLTIGCGREGWGEENMMEETEEGELCTADITDEDVIPEEPEINWEKLDNDVVVGDVVEGNEVGPGSKVELLPPLFPLPLLFTPPCAVIWLPPLLWIKEEKDDEEDVAIVAQIPSKAGMVDDGIKVESVESQCLWFPLPPLL